MQSVPSLCEGVALVTGCGVATATSREGQSAVRCTFLELVETLLSELDAALWKLGARVLVDKGLVQLAERPVLLLDFPLFFAIERDAQHVYCVVSVVNRVGFDIGILDKAVKRHLEEMRSAEVVDIFGAGSDVLQEDFSGVERVTELALAGHAVLEALLVHFHLGNLLALLVRLVLLAVHGLAEFFV